MKIQGLFDPRMSHCGLVVSAVDCEPRGSRFESTSHRKLMTLTFPPVIHDWVTKGLGMSSRICVTGHIKDHVPLIEKGGASSPGGRFPRSFIYQVVIFTELNKLYDCIFSPWRWSQMPIGRRTSTQTQS